MHRIEKWINVHILNKNEQMSTWAYEETPIFCDPKPPTTTPAVFARYTCVYLSKLKTFKNLDERHKGENNNRHSKSRESPFVFT